MQTLKVTISLTDSDSVSGVLAVPEKFEAGKTTGVIFAHGAGNDMHKKARK